LRFASLSKHNCGAFRLELRLPKPISNIGLMSALAPFGMDKVNGVEGFIREFARLSDSDSP
jgi:hypothetical protein